MQQSIQLGLSILLFTSTWTKVRHLNWTELATNATVAKYGQHRRIVNTRRLFDNKLQLKYLMQLTQQSI